MSDLSVSNGLVSQREFSEVLSAHVGLDFDGSPVLSTVDFSDRSDHLGGDDAVSQMSLNTLGLFSIRGIFDGLLQLLIISKCAIKPSKFKFFAKLVVFNLALLN